MGQSFSSHEDSVNARYEGKNLRFKNIEELNRISSISGGVHVTQDPNNENFIILDAHPTIQQARKIVAMGFRYHDLEPQTKKFRYIGPDYLGRQR